MQSSIKKLSVLMAGLLLSSTLGCSNQYRNADLGMDANDVLDVLNTLETEVSASGSSNEHVQKFFELKNNPNSSIYFADAYASGGSLGPIVSVFSVIDFGFLGSDLAGLSFSDLSEVRIAFIDLPTDAGHECALMVDVKIGTDENFVTNFFSCTGVETGGGEFLADLQNASGDQIALRSYDVDKNGDLKGVIQMKLSIFDAAGNELDNGKFSTLVGFGP